MIVRITHTRVAQRELKTFFKQFGTNLTISKAPTGWEVELEVDDLSDTLLKQIRTFFVHANRPAALHAYGRMFIGPALDAAALEYRVLGAEYKAIRIRRQELKAQIDKLKGAK